MLNKTRQQLLLLDTPFASICMVFFIVVLASTGIFLSDMYAPALPSIARSFQVSADTVRLSISFFLFGVTAPQLLFGPLSDAWGRKKIIVPGFLIAIIGSTVCLSSGQMWELSVGRFVQGVGIGAISLNARAIARDIFSEQRRVKVFAYIGTVIALAPAIAPLIGGYIQHFLGWRMIFVVMTSLLVLGALLISALLPETNRHIGTQPLRLRIAISHYSKLLMTNSFMTNAVMSSCVFSLVMVYFTISPHLLQVELRLTIVHYSWSCTAVVLMMVFSRLLNIVCLRYFSISDIIALGVLTVLLSSISLVALSLLRIFTVDSLLIPVMVMMLGIGLVMGNVMARAFEEVGSIAGSAGALYGAIQVLLAAICSAIAAHLPAATMTSFAFFCCAVSTCLVVVALRQFVTDRRSTTKARRLSFLQA